MSHFFLSKLAFQKRKVNDERRNKIYTKVYNAEKSISETGRLKTNSGETARPFLSPCGGVFNAKSLGSSEFCDPSHVTP
jgi:hypothetical protein